MAALNGESVDGSQTAVDIRAIVDSIKIEHAVDSTNSRIFSLEDHPSISDVSFSEFSSQFFQQVRCIRQSAPPKK